MSRFVTVKGNQDINADQLLAVRWHDFKAQYPQPGIEDGCPAEYTMVVVFVGGDSATYVYETKEERDRVLKEIREDR